MVKRIDSPERIITEDMKNRAAKFANDVVTETYNRLKRNISQRKQKIYFGKIGEEVLSSYFNEFGLISKIDYEIYLGTTSIDETDLIVSGYNIDIKVGSQPFHKRLLVVKQYFDNGHQSDFYVAINIYNNETTAVIYGFATKEEIKLAHVAKWDKVNPVDDYTLLYDILHPIETLVEILKNKPKSIEAI